MRQRPGSRAYGLRRPGVANGPADLAALFREARRDRQSGFHGDVHPSALVVQPWRGDVSATFAKRPARCSISQQARAAFGGGEQRRGLLFAKRRQWVGHSRAQRWDECRGEADAEQDGSRGCEGDGIQRADIEEER